MKTEYIVGIGEILWDMLPEGRRLGGAPANFAYHVSQFGLNSVAVSAVGRDEAGDAVIRELNAYLWSCYHIFPGQAGRIKTEELCGICKEVYTEYLKEKEPKRQSEVLRDLIEDAQELRERCIATMPSYLKKVDESAWWNAKTRKKMEQWKTERENP